MTKWTLDRDKFLSKNEVSKLRRHLEDKALADLAKGRSRGVRNWAVIDFALSTGARVSEIAKINCGDLNLKGKEPTIRIHGKRGKERHVFVDRKFSNHMKRFLKWKKMAGEPVEDDSPLFISEHTKNRYSTRAIQLIFKTAARNAGLRGVYSIHATRHSYGTYLYHKTKDLRLVQTQLGHSGITTTQVYLNNTPEMASAAVNGLWDEGEEEIDSTLEKIAGDLGAVLIKHDKK